MDETIDNFIAELQRSIAGGTFVKLTLGNYKGTEEHLQKIFIRPVDTKKGARILFQYRGKTSDIAKNFSPEEAADLIKSHLHTGFRSGHLFTTENDFQLTIGKRSAKITTGKPTFRSADEQSHDREKHYQIDPNAFYLKALGITTERTAGTLPASGAKDRPGQHPSPVIIRSDQRDKWKQINKFIEVLDGLYESSDLKNKPTLNIVDMGSGKGYLTFAVYDYFSGRNGSVSERGNRAVGDDSTNSPPSKGGAERASARSGVVNGRPASGSAEETLTVTGVESRSHLVSLCNEIAQAGGYDGLKFVQGNIADFDPGSVDILIALHACDTATDDALYKGITSNASIIVAAPCCHHEVKKQLRSPDVLAGILKHPVLHERTAETITDGLRSMLLEREGYKTNMFEFVSTEHTPKNNLLVAVRTRTGDPSKTAEINSVTQTFGIQYQRLLDRLANK